MLLRIASATLVVALIVFCGVQDRLTARAVSQYVTAQRAALADHRRPVAVDDVMVPGVRASVRAASWWSGVVLAAGVAGAGLVVLRGRRG